MKASFGVLYRKLIPILCFCLLATALTGIIVGLSKRLFQLPDRVVEILISLHQGMFLGDQIMPIYVFLLGLGAFGLGLKTIVEGRYSLLFQSLPPSVANAYRIIALIIVIPLAVCVETGVAYRLGIDWFGISSRETTTFLSIHGGSSLGTVLGISYLLAVGTALITLSILNYKSHQIPPRIKQTLRQKLKTTYFSHDSNTNKFVLNNKAKVAIVYTLIALLGILYYATSAQFVAIAMMVVVAILSTVILGNNLIKGWQQQQILTIPHAQEAESITILKAIPDSMLRISKDGICLSYMPAKEATSFVLYGNIVNKHINEFLAPEIAEQFMTSAQLSLQTGSTNICRFPIFVGNEEQRYEARVTPIGETEVLILVRETADLDYAPPASRRFLPPEDTITIQLLTESELIQVLEDKLSDEEAKNHVLFCLAIDAGTNDDGVLVVDDDLIFQMAIEIKSWLPSSIISRLNDHNLTILLSDRNMEAASLLVDDLYRNLNQLVATWQNNSHPIKFNVALLEVDADNSDAAALIDTAKITCQIAKQKVNFKTFW